MGPRVAIIGGTGVGEALRGRARRPLFVPTPAGMLRGRLLDLGGADALLVSRHAAGHKVPPHRVNYRAIALGLKQLGVRRCVASAAVGSLRPDWGPGTLAACSDFIDLTGRFPTLFEREVRHTDFSQPFGPQGRDALTEAGRGAGVPVRERATYVCANGPRYETPREIELFAKIGDVVGMTAASEAVVMREAGIDYAALAVVTNLAAGLHDAPLSHDEVVRQMEQGRERTLAVLLGAARLLAEARA